MADWASLDMSAAIAEARRRRAPGGLPLLLVGHSIGGNSVAYAQGARSADALLGVAAQWAQWRLWPRPHRWVTWAFFHAMLPLSVALLGHAPGWVLGGGAQPLPPGVARQWARWGRSQGFSRVDAARLSAHDAFDAIDVPVHLWDIEDDLTFAPARTVDELARQFPRARLQRHSLRLADAGRSRLGHFGVFRRDVGPRVWPRLLQAIEQATPALREAGLAPA